MDDPFQRLLAGIALTWQIPAVKTLSCAPDVEERLREEALAAPYPWDFLVTEGDERRLVSLMGFQVHVIPHYQPGHWKLVKHDRCETVCGGGIDEGTIIVHDDCTVMDQHPLECQGS
jgi:hypothetical protein